MKKQIILIIVVGVIVLAFATNFLAQNQKKEQKQEENIIKTLKIGEITLDVGVADTAAKREQGLSGKTGLGESEGLLFVFEKGGYYGFWMKDMNFPIDIAWLDKDKKIINIEKAVDPKTYPKVFNPTAPSLYVLETSANFFENSKIKIGDFAEF